MAFILGSNAANRRNEDVALMAEKEVSMRYVSNLWPIEFCLF